MTPLSPQLSQNIDVLAVTIFSSVSGWLDVSELDQSSTWNKDKKSLIQLLWKSSPKKHRLKEFGEHGAFHMDQRSHDSKDAERREENVWD
jgi:hypothetical protein